MKFCASATGHHDSKLCGFGRSSRLQSRRRELRRAEAGPAPAAVPGAAGTVTVTGRTRRHSNWANSHISVLCSSEPGVPAARVQRGNPGDSLLKRAGFGEFNSFGGRRWLCRGIRERVGTGFSSSDFICWEMTCNAFFPARKA